MKFGKKGALLLLVFTMALSVFALNVYADTDGDNGDDTPPDPPTHIAVESISFASTTATVGTPLTLSATVSPADASYRAITWSVSGTGASVVGNTLTLTAPGNVTVIATIANGTAPGAPFTREFTIAVTGPAHVPVAGITGVPLTATA
ncbi:MAG: Ig-like domain-containing protein, partial [Defluviitaleaceae bacterium]|nr:Ig-like domain-containing protein [Defluviitaleaceae bacterium]